MAKFFLLSVGYTSGECFAPKITVWADSPWIPCGLSGGSDGGERCTIFGMKFTH